MVSLGSVSLLQCYGLSIGCVLWRRITHPETLPPATYSLGKYGIPINALAVTYATWAFFWAFWPPSHPTTAETFNWASVLFVAALVGAAVYFVVGGRKRYFGPVADVQGRRVKRR